MKIVTGVIYDIFYMSDKIVIQLRDARVYKTNNKTLMCFIQMYIKIGMLVTLHLENNEIKSIDINL